MSSLLLEVTQSKGVSGLIKTKETQLQVFCWHEGCLSPVVRWKPSALHVLGLLAHTTNAADLHVCQQTPLRRAGVNPRASPRLSSHYKLTGRWDESERDKWGVRFMRRCAMKPGVWSPCVLPVGRSWKCVRTWAKGAYVAFIAPFKDEREEEEDRVNKGAAMM